MVRRGQSGLSGVLLVDKPAGITSHDVVNRVRRAFAEKRVGHAGTLDPAATGLLVVCVGPATRLAQYLTAAAKSYEALIVFGSQTDTDDADGRVVCVGSVPDEVADPFFATGFVASLVGAHDQIPPAYSAIKRDGVTAYTAARKGEVFELEPRSIEVNAAALLGVEVEESVTWTVRFDVSKGTYIRALARDIGTALGTYAHLGALRRVSSGELGVSDAVGLDVLLDHPDPSSLFVDPVAALALPVCEVDTATVDLIYHGKSLDASRACASCLDEGPVALVHEGRLLSIHTLENGVLKPATVISGGVPGVR